MYFWGEPASGVAVTHFVPLNAPLEVVTVRWNGSLLFAFGANSAWTLPALVPGLLLHPRKFFNYQMCPSEDVRLSYPFLDKITYLLPTPFKPSIGWRIHHWLSNKTFLSSWRREKTVCFLASCGSDRGTRVCVCVSRSYPVIYRPRCCWRIGIERSRISSVCCVEFHRGLDTVKEREKKNHWLASIG